MNMILENNQALVYGEIISDFTYSHEVLGEVFYIVDVRTRRLSGVFDIVPVMVSERMIDVTKNYRGCFVEVEGQFRSCNWHDNGKSHLLLSLFAMEIGFLDKITERVKNNQVFLDGYIGKKPIYRETPRGREIADVLVAVNRPYSKSDYIPCVLWGRNARYVSQLEVGTHMQLEGRIQSREYIKKLDDGTQETRTAYEVSVSRIDIVEKSEENE